MPHRSLSAPSKKTGFSALALIVPSFVIAIIANLAILLLAAPSHARAASHTTVCRHNLKQLQTGTGTTAQPSLKVIS